MSVDQGRNADILQSIVDDVPYTDPPQSRIEDLLLQVKEVIEEGGGSKIRLADVSGAAVAMTNTTAALTWSDPEDIVVSGSVLAKWAGTKVLRKIGSAPESITDGVVVVDSKVKNQYSANGYEDTGLEYGVMYYYRWFPYTEEGIVTDGSAVSVTPARTKITTVPSQSGTLTYDGTEQTASWSNYDPDKMTVTGNTGTNAGTYTASFTPKSDYCWDDDSTTAKAVQWTIGKLSFTVPTQSGSLTYNGTAQTASWSNYDSNAMTVTGNTATNAGNHTAVFSLTDTSNTQWVGGTTSDKNVTWTIGKATGSVTLSTNSVTLNAGAPSATVTVTVVGNGTVTATSSDITVATVSKSGNTFTINNVNLTSGTATITFNLAATTNYTADSATASVTASFTAIYGAEWDGTSDPSWSRTDAAELFTDPNPAVNNGNGSSPFDTIMPWAGMVREERTGGTMIKIPKYWYKWTRTSGKMKLQIANYAADGFYVAPAHADRGDGKGERDYVYVGAYHCASDYKSKTGVKPVGDKTRATFRSGIHALGSTIWQYDYAMYWTIMMLYLVEYANWNSQAVIGYGCGNNSSAENNGLCDSMTYHTGTNAASRTTYGHVRYRGIEGLWDNVYDWCDGIYFSSSNVYCIKNPASFSDSSGGTLVGTRATSSNYISGWTNPTASGYEYALYPNAVSGSESTYVCDYCYYDSSGVVLRVGGDYSQAQRRGAFYLNGDYGASGSGSGIGSRIMELP